MRLHALILALAVLGAHAASIPDKRDIEKKLAKVVQEVLDKDGVPIPVDNEASAQEMIEENAEIKDIENNLRKQPVDIPVKVVVEDLKPVLKSEDKKEDNEVAPADESSEIVREEIDLKNPGPPQRTQHDTQNPETFMDSLKNVVFKNSEWKASEQYAQLQKEISSLKENFENRMKELYGSIQEHLNMQPTAAVAVDEKPADSIKVRAVERQEASNGGGTSTGSGTSGTASGGSSGSTDSSSGSWGGGPFGGFFQNWAQSFQQNLQSLNQTVNSYWNNQTANSNSSSNSNQCGQSGGVFGGWGQSNPLAGFGQQSQQPAAGQAQSDEPARPSAGGIWQTIQQNVQSFIGGGNQQPPASAQSDSQQPPQPNRPVIQAFQNVIQQAGSLFNRPGSSEPQAVVPASSLPAQEGSNVVPAQPDAQKQPEPQPSGPIKQMIASNPVAQGIVGAIQNIQNTILPTRSREEVKSAPDASAEASKGGFIGVRPPPNRPSPGDNNDNSDGAGSASSRLEAAAAEDAKPAEEPAAESAPAVEPTKESVAEKTE